MTSSFLLQGGCVLTLGARTQNHAQADVLIEDGLVAEVGAGLRSRRAEVIDASNAIVMPGFVDAHRRCRMSLFKNEGVGGSSPSRSETSPADVYAGTLVSLLGAIEAGITTVVDWYDGPASEEHLDAALRAHADSGLRTVFVVATGGLADVLARQGQDVSANTRIAVGFSLSPDTGDAISSDWMAAREAGVRVHAIADSSGHDRLAELGRNNLLGPDVTVAHCIGLSEEELDVLSGAAVGIALTPTSDMTNGNAAPPMQALLDRGIRPGLGVDDERLGAADILAQMRSAISVQHATYFDLKLAGKGGLPNLLSTRDVIKYGTIDGARAVGLESVTGSIEVGKAADLIVVRTDRPNLHPVNDPIGAVVWGMDTSNIDWVFVGGHPRLRNGVLDADVARVRQLVADARKPLNSGRAVTEASGGPA